MQGYKKFILDNDKAIKYILGQLNDGLRLSKYITEKHDLTNGVVTTYLPSATSNESLYDFKTGGKLPVPASNKFDAVEVPDTKFHLVPSIESFMRKNENGIVVFENFLAGANDPWLTSCVSRYVTYNDEVYIVLLKDYVDAGLTEAAIVESESYVLTGIMSVLKRGHLAINSKQKISSIELEEFAEDAEKIIVGAYDGEGYLIWSKY